MPAAPQDPGAEREAYPDRDGLRWHHDFGYREVPGPVPEYRGPLGEDRYRDAIQVKAAVDLIRGETYGSFPRLTHAEEEGLYSQISGSVPDAAPSRVDRELADDEVLTELGASVVSTPGHTDGSIAVHFHEAGALFTGDVATVHQGYVVLGPFNHDRAKARESFRRFAGIDVDTVCFGHGQPLLGPDTQKLRDAALADQVLDPLG